MKPTRIQTTIRDTDFDKIKSIMNETGDDLNDVVRKALGLYVWTHNKICQGLRIGAIDSTTNKVETLLDIDPWQPAICHSTQPETSTRRTEKMPIIQRELQNLLDEATHSLDLAEENDADAETIQGLAGRCNGIRDALKLFKKLTNYIVIPPDAAMGDDACPLCGGELGSHGVQDEIKKAYDWIRRVGHSRECDCNDDATAKCTCQGDEIVDNAPTKADNDEHPIKKFELAVLWTDGTWEDESFQRARTEEEAINATISNIDSGDRTMAHVTVICEQDDDGDDDDDDDQEEV